MLNSVFPIRQIEPNQPKSRRAWSGSSMILCFVLLGMKRVRLAQSDDLDSLFRISRWVTPANRNESGGKKPNLTRRRGEGRGENRKESTVSSPISPPRSPRLRVNKTPGGAQSYGMKRVRLAKSDDQDFLSARPTSVNNPWKTDGPGVRLRFACSKIGEKRKKMKYHSTKI